MAFSFSPKHKNENARTDFGDLPIFGDFKYRSVEFRNSYGYLWDTPSLEPMRQLFAELNAEVQHTISFTVPQLWCWGCYSDGIPTRLFEMNTVTTVTKTKLYKGSPIPNSSVVVATKYSGATNIAENNDSVWYGSLNDAYLRTIKDFNYEGTTNSISPPWTTEVNHFMSSERIGGTTQWTGTGNWTYMDKIASANSSYSDKTITFDTETLSIVELQSEYSYIYSINTRCYSNGSGFLSYYGKNATYGAQNASMIIGGAATRGTISIVDGQITIVDPSTLTVTATFLVKNMGTEVIGTPFLMKGVKYNSYNLFRRAMLTVDTQLIDNATTSLDDVVLNDNGVVTEQKSIDFSIIVDPIWRNRMLVAKIYETIFESKNLWEVLIQIGYYLHAIPYLEFAKDGTDRFVLKFNQLGDTKQKKDTNTKITVFNSRNLDEYFTQYDAYITNLFSPQNIVEEWIVCKTSDPSYLVYNDVAELRTDKPILEIVEFDLIYDGHAGGTAGINSILTYIFEESIYQILTSDDPTKIRPAKGNSLYYTFGTDKIQGLQYLPPQASSGTFAYSLQQIVMMEFGAGTNPINIPQNIKYNNLAFRIKYRTQDSLRISQVRPDIGDFVKNSKYEQYPHHEQFYGQQDKIVDSERLSANLYGKLIRVGNVVAQHQEYVSAGDEKEPGDLVLIDTGNGKEPYYVTSIEAEYYHEGIFQKVNYSKNFNQLSQVVTIPSEPRFYEVSERSKIRREVRIMEFMELSIIDNNTNASPKYIGDNWRELMQSIIFAKDKMLPNFAYTKFMADNLRKHTGSFGQVVKPESLFPSSDIDRTTDPNAVQPMPPSNSVACIVPLLHYPLHDGIVFEWDMEDNFKAGDFINKDISGNNNTANQSYYSQQSLRYVDILGRADLLQFKLFNKTQWNNAEIQSLPKIDNITIPDMIIGIQGADSMAIALDKDNREELSFNYQINLLHKAQQGDDDFITFPNLFGDKDNDLKVLLLADRQSQFNENINITPSVTLADDVPYSFSTSTNGSIQISFDTVNIIWQNNGTIDQVKCICFYQNNVDPLTGVETGARVGYIYKNVDRLPDSDKLQPWYIYPVFNKESV